MLTNSRRVTIVGGLAAIILIAGVVEPGWADPGDPLDGLIDACSLNVEVQPVPVGGTTVVAVASYSCAHQQSVISVSGCLLLGGVPLDCDNTVDQIGQSVEVTVSAPCVPGIWTALAIGSATSRLLPDVAPSSPRVVIDCDPLVQSP